MKRQRVTLVTGATDGIGRAVAISLAAEGCTVIVCGRNKQRAKEVLDLLFHHNPAGKHIFICADLSLMADTARVAQEVKVATERLDSIIFCAGNISFIPSWTSENLERSFALNYLSRYLLSRLLLPMINNSNTGALIYVANPGVYDDTLNFDDLQYRTGKRGLRVAARAQVANDLFTLELADRVKGTSTLVACVWPGIVNSEIFQHGVGINPFLRGLMKLVQRIIGISVSQAAITPTVLSQREFGEILPPTNFFGPNMKPKYIRQAKINSKRRKQLWDASESIIEGYLSSKNV